MKSLNTYMFRVGAEFAVAFARRATRHGAPILNSKRAPKRFYKGRGAKKLGHSRSKGGFQVEKWRVPEYVLPGSTLATAQHPASLIRIFNEEMDKRKVMSATEIAELLEDQLDTRQMPDPDLKPYVSHRKK